MSAYGRNFTFHFWECEGRTSERWPQGDLEEQKAILFQPPATIVILLIFTNSKAELNGFVWEMRTGSRYAQESRCEGRHGVNALSCHQQRYGTLPRTDKDYTSHRRINRRGFGMNHTRNFKTIFIDFFLSSIAVSVALHHWPLFASS